SRSGWTNSDGSTAGVQSRTVGMGAAPGRCRVIQEYRHVYLIDAGNEAQETTGGASGRGARNEKPSGLLSFRAPRSALGSSAPGNPTKDFRVVRTIGGWEGRGADGPR